METELEARSSDTMGECRRCDMLPFSVRRRQPMTTAALKVASRQKG